MQLAQKNPECIGSWYLITENCDASVKIHSGLVVGMDEALEFNLEPVQELLTLNICADGNLYINCMDSGHLLQTKSKAQLEGIAVEPGTPVRLNLFGHQMLFDTDLVYVQDRAALELELIKTDGHQSPASEQDQVVQVEEAHALPPHESRFPPRIRWAAASCVLIGALLLALHEYNQAPPSISETARVDNFPDSSPTLAQAAAIEAESATEAQAGRDGEAEQARIFEPVPAEQTSPLQERPELLAPLVEAGSEEPEQGIDLSAVAGPPMADPIDTQTDRAGADEGAAIEVAEEHAGAEEKAANAKVERLLDSQLDTSGPAIPEATEVAEKVADDTNSSTGDDFSTAAQPERVWPETGNWDLPTFNDDRPPPALEPEPDAIELPLSQLTAIARTPPNYPREGYASTVSVEAQFNVDVSGKVQDLQIKGDPPESFRRSVVEAIEGWQFEPYEVGGTPQQVRTSVRITFRN